MRLRPGDAHPAVWLAAHLRILQLSPAKKTDDFLVDTTGVVYLGDSRKKTRSAKLHKIPNAILSILSVPEATGHQDGHNRREWPVKGSCNAWSGRLRFRSHKRGSVAGDLGPFSFNSGWTENIVS